MKTMLCNYLGPFFPLSHWTQRPTVMVHRMFSQSLHTLKKRQKSECWFQVSTNFFASSYAKFHVQMTEKTEGFKQLHRQSLIIVSDQIPLNLLPKFSFDILTFLHIYSCAVVQKSNKMHEKKLFVFVTKYESASLCGLLCVISHLLAVHILKRKLDFFVHTVLPQFTVHSVAFNKLESQYDSGSDARRNSLRISQ